MKHLLPSGHLKQHWSAWKMKWLREQSSIAGLRVLSETILPFSFADFLPHLRVIRIQRTSAAMVGSTSGCAIFAILCQRAHSSSGRCHDVPPSAFPRVTDWRRRWASAGGARGWRPFNVLTVIQPSGLFFNPVEIVLPACLTDHLRL